MLSRTGRGGESGDERFTEELSQLKQCGASVLVVGSTRADQRRHVRRRLLGMESKRQRKRVFVSTGTADHDDPTRTQAGELDAESDTVAHVRYRTQTRSTAAPATATADDVPDATATTATGLASLGVAISNAIESFETEMGGFEPGDLRVGLESLVPLLEEYGAERVFKFVHLTNGRALDADGLIHYHLPVDCDADIVSVLSPLFDIIVELRERDGLSQERWTITDGGHSSGWLSTDRS